MTRYLVFFNQQWVGDHPAAFYEEAGVRARAVVREMREAGVLVFAGGLDEDLDRAFTADLVDGAVVGRRGRFRETAEWLGGMTIIDVADESAARHWAARIAEACGWPQEVRPFGEPSLDVPET